MGFAQRKRLRATEEMGVGCGSWSDHKLQLWIAANYESEINRPLSAFPYPASATKKTLLSTSGV
jgi:hypothetical protein